MTSDELDAVTAALVGRLFLMGSGEMLGGVDGILIPVSSVPQAVRVKKVRQQVRREMVNNSRQPGGDVSRASDELVVKAEGFPAVRIVSQHGSRFHEYGQSNDLRRANRR